MKMRWGFEKSEENLQIVTPEEEHCVLASIANSYIDASDAYDKLCKIDKGANEYML